jgi:hypothetical protein
MKATLKNCWVISNEEVETMEVKINNINETKKLLSKKPWFCMILFLLIGTGIYAQKGPLIYSEADTSSIKIGEQIQFKITVETDTTSQVIFPEGQTFSPLEVVEAYKTDTTRSKDRITLERIYALTQFDSGAYVIPIQHIDINGMAYYTDSVGVMVANVAVDTVNQKMYDIKPLVEVDKNLAGMLKLVLWIVLGLALIGALIYWFYFRKKPLTEEEQEALLPPYDRALLELKRLENSKYLIQDEFKKYYSELTSIVRSYLEEDVHVTALESTTNQLIDKLELLKDSGELKLEEQTIQQFKQILQTADLVKFARSKPATNVAEKDRLAVEQIVMKTKEALPEPSEEELMEQAAFQEELARKKRKKKLITYASAAALTLLVGSAILTAYYGPKYVWDTLTFHPTKQLLEGEWVASSYGFPPVLLETPEVLVREKVNIDPDKKASIKELHSFKYSCPKNLLTIGTSSLLLNEMEDPKIEESVEDLLKKFEAQGARNIITKQEEFVTQSGITGVKVYGNGSFKENESDDLIRGKYAIILFGGKGFQQHLVLSWEEDDAYAQEIVDRILNKLEVKTET